MAKNLGKTFEEKFKSDWKKCFPDSFLLRLYDTTNGYMSINNPCDFLCMPGNDLFMIECKSHKGASIPFDAIPQYSRLLEHIKEKHVKPGVIIWFYEKDRVIWVPVKSMYRMKKDNEKSIKLSKLDSGKYEFTEIPSKKLRTFMDSDYTVLVENNKPIIE